MHPYIPNTPEQQREMLSAIGLNSFEELFATVPENVRSGGLNLPGALCELDLTKKLKAMADRNINAQDYACFLGAGAYDHFIPAAVSALLSRQEFYTAYTPYQPEISQGTLQAIFEYQTMICSLTGMDISNASMYDGASAMAEAAIMACGAVKRDEVLVARSAHPQAREVLNTYARFRKIRVREFGYKDGQFDAEDLEKKISSKTAAVIIQSPNFFGAVEDIEQAAHIAHEKGTLLITSSDLLSLSILKSPGEAGADITVGEGQSAGSPLSYGGPYLGFFAAKGSLLRSMPGRIVGQTEDRNKKRCYVLTIQTREQHIRREKATSNICTNEALCALASCIYLSLMGAQGLKKAAHLCLNNAKNAYDALISTGRFSPVFAAPFFREFALFYDGDIKKLNGALLSERIIGGYDLRNYYPELSGCLLFAVTEKRTAQEIDALAGKAAAI